ncbi:MAG: cation:proton antiporter, partial [Methylococcales bacterium]|nr:cation:proton antiporter [Methylococcales bacterium]
IFNQTTSNTMTSGYLLDIIILLIGAVVTVPFFQAIKLGAVPGFLIAGVIVGPFGFGLINNISEISHLADIGVVLLLFVIGIELKPSRLWLMRRLVFGLGTLQVILTGFLLGAVIYFFFDISLRTAILVGPALALSSTAFVLQLLAEQKALSSTYGRTSFSVLLFQDLAVIPLLVLVSLLAMPDLSIGEDIGLALIESVFILGIIILLGRYLLHPILHRVALAANPEVFTASAVLIVLGAALVFESIGLSMSLGAFLAGLLISDSSYKHQIIAEIQPFRGLFLGLFFMSMGMSFNLGLLFETPLFSFSAVAGLVFIKIVVLFPLTYFFGLKIKNCFAVALILAQSGEFALVLFSLANQSELLSDDLFQQLLLVVLLSMLVTPVLAHFAHRLSAMNLSNKIKNIERPDKTKAPIVIAGFGRVGQRVGEILSISGHPFVALDSDALMVEQEREKGLPVFYGDVTNSEIMKSAGASNAKIIIVTLNDPAASEKVVSLLRKTYPQIKIFVRGYSLSQCRKLLRLGASDVVSEYVETSLELARLTLINVKVNKKKREAILGDFRRTYYAQIDDINGFEERKK